MMFNTISIADVDDTGGVYRFVWLDRSSEDNRYDVVVLLYVQGRVTAKLHSRDEARTIFKDLHVRGGKARWGGVQHRDSEKMVLSDGMNKALKLLAND